MSNEEILKDILRSAGLWPMADVLLEFRGLLQHPATKPALLRLSHEDRWFAEFLEELAKQIGEESDKDESILLFQQRRETLRRIRKSTDESITRKVGASILLMDRYKE